MTTMENTTTITATDKNAVNGEIDGDFSSGNKIYGRISRGNIYQILACLIANTSVLGPAMGLGYSAIALGPLVAPDSEIKITPSEESWIASITAITTPIGCILSSVFMRRGRRFGIIGTSLISAIGWLVVYFSYDVSHLLIGRAICGVAIGLASVPTTVYAAEISSPKLRGYVVTWTSVSIAFGVLIVYIFGYFFQNDWRLVALLCSLFPITSLILVIWRLPESPVWLRSTGHLMEAEKSLRKLNGIDNSDVETPSDLLLELSPLSRDTINDKEELSKSFRSRGGIFSSLNMKPLLIMVGYFFFQQFSGTFVVIYYAVDFTLEAGVSIDGHIAAILIGVTRLIGTMLVSYISRKFGRRIPSIISGIGMTIFMGILSMYVWSDYVGNKINDNGIIPVISILMYIFSSALGFLVLPFAMIGEIYPAKVKDIFSGLTTCLAYIFSFSILKVYPDMLHSFGKHGVFLFYAIVSFIGTVFIVLFLPETKGKSLKDIEELFVKKNQNIIHENNKNLIIDNTTEEIIDNKNHNTITRNSQN